jgi:prophage regulatory protein
MTRLLRLPDVEARTGLKHSAIYQRIAEGEFPRQVPLGPKAVGWLEHEVDAWIDARAAERDGVETKQKVATNASAAR